MSGVWVVGALLESSSTSLRQTCWKPRCKDVKLDIWIGAGWHACTATVELGCCMRNLLRGVLELIITLCLAIRWGKSKMRISLSWFWIALKILLPFHGECHSSGWRRPRLLPTCFWKSLCSFHQFQSCYAIKQAIKLTSALLNAGVSPGLPPHRLLGCRDVRRTWQQAKPGLLEVFHLGLGSMNFGSSKHLQFCDFCIASELTLNHHRITGFPRHGSGWFGETFVIKRKGRIEGNEITDLDALGWWLAKIPRSLILWQEMHN